MKKIISLLLVLALTVSLLPAAVSAETLEEQHTHARTTPMQNGGDLNSTPPTKEEIRARRSSRTVADTIYAVQPSTSAPYQAGQLTQAYLQEALDHLNYVRYVANLPAVELYEPYNEQAQHAAVISAANGYLSHNPTQPADMEDSFYALAYTGASTSNLSLGYGSLVAAINGCLNDSTSLANLSGVGHRRWLLNPNMAVTGFGYAGNSAATKVFGDAGYRTDPIDYDFVAWPSSGNFPKDLISTVAPWSVTLNPDRYAVPQREELSITVTREADGQTWTFDSTTAEPVDVNTPYLTINQNGYGVRLCVIFSPGGWVDGLEGVYEVEVKGLRTVDGAETELCYEVDFFDASCVEHNYQIVGTTAPTCTASGYTTYACGCGDSYQGDTTEPLGHSFENGVCTACGREESAAEIVASGTCGDSVTWTLDSEGVLTLSGTGLTYDYPSGVPTFYTHKSSVYKVIIEDGISALGVYLFWEMDSITEVSIPGSVNTIARSAFSGCDSLTSITFAGDAPSISYNAFNGVTATAYYPAENATWTEDVRQDYYGTITWVPLLACPHMETSVVNSVDTTCTAPGYTGDTVCSVCGETLSTGEEIPALGHIFENGACATCGEPEPEEEPVASGICGDSVTWTLDSEGTLTLSGTGATYDYPQGLPTFFTYNTSVYKVVIEDGISALGRFLFWEMVSIMEVSIPGSVDTIDDYAFSGCDSLTSITLAGDAPSFGTSCFQGVTADVCYPAGNATWTEEAMQDYGGTITWVPCGGEIVASGTCGDSVTWTLDSEGTLTISGTGEMYGFSEDEKPTYLPFGSDIQTVIIEDGVTGIGKYAFYGCASLTSITIPDGVTSIGDYAFCDCTSLTSITIPDSVTSIGAWSFAWCSNLTNINIPDSVTSIGESVFVWCSNLTNITIPDSVTSIYSGAFSGCTSLTSITIPDSVTSIYSGAFYGCTGLSSIRFEGDVPELAGDIFMYVTANACYPADNATWTEDARQNYGGEITWIPYGDCAHIETSVQNAVEATCTEPGYTGDTVCNACGETLSTGEEIPSVGPDWGEGVIIQEPTCEQEGYIEYTCQNCGETRVEPIPTIDHTYTEAVTDPTCTEGGYTTHTCVCGDSYTDGETDPLGHDWDEGVITRDPTEADGGEITYTCWTCGEAYSDVIPHEHAYTSAVTDPNCTQGGYTTHTCTCGDSYTDNYTDPLGHSWDEGAVTQEPTETGGGEMTYTCTVCGETRTEPIDHEHAYTDEVTDPTCTEGGYTTHTCECGDSYTDSYTDPLGHDWSEGVIILEPTCTECGYTEYMCLTCGAIRAESVPTIDHTYTEAVTDPTCTEGGYTTHTCGCGDSYTDNYTDPLGHSWDEGVVTQEPTETAAGQKTFTCQTCGEIRVEPVPPEACVHEYTSAVTAPTCTGGGYTTHICGFCGYTYTDSETDPLGHSWDEGVVTVEPTEAGGGEMTYTCTVCGETKTEPIDHEHAYTEEVTDPTCTEGGYTTHTCGCGDSYTDSYTDPLGHSWDEGVVTVEPTEVGGGEKTYTCTVCGETKTESMDHEHTYTDEVTAPTCTVGGYTTHTCGCGDSYADNDTAPLGHSWDEGVVTKEPTAEESGELTFTCQTCGETRVEDITGAPCTHEFTYTMTMPTCTAEGYTTYTCTLCGYSYTTGRIPALDHIWDEGVVTKEPTMEEEGEKLFTCTDCGETRVEILPVADHVHSYTPTVVEPSCTEGGYTTHTCSTCGESYRDSETAPLGHDWDEGVITREPTAEAIGEMTYTCQSCGGTRTEAIAHTHTFTPVITHPTCTSGGYTTYSCECGQQYIDALTDALGHSFVDNECTLCGAQGEGGEVEIIRLAGAHRYETAFKAADQMKQELDISKFSTIVVASGKDFADALSGSYLAAVKNAPILLACDVESVNDLVKDYIKDNLRSNGTIYILGGTKAIPDSFTTGLGRFNVKRLAGANRFLTNLEVLKEAGVGSKDILVCTGMKFADSLSASATRLPILLVYGDRLMDQQTAFLQTLSGNAMYVIGGTSAVSEGIHNQLSGYGGAMRLSGGNRFETSMTIAQYFFQDPEAAVLAYGMNFPDGLCGGSLAASMDAPLILTMENWEACAATYVQGTGMKKGIVLGGESLIPDASVNTIFGVR